ncbi:hypothetical protein JDV02_000630 [Purpureocillium takamizusanense]|uniref:Uncharacterized protein n=1 Tax=Purpureocillium takamizusanense TaxID=2060973 RepID=A0A9Q8Q5A9_9HYPO|nr:uncharacterized protein JDV02_000630 [Purpureocillium takamizusanense]UNI13943.1 hypothetical protein JDV02_000630 [Purpureocillium takamizusanense]
MCGLAGKDGSAKGGGLHLVAADRRSSARLPVPPPPSLVSLVRPRMSNEALFVGGQRTLEWVPDGSLPASSLNSRPHHTPNLAQALCSSPPSFSAALPSGSGR